MGWSISSLSPGVYLVVAMVALVVLGLALWSKHKVQVKLGQHYAMMPLKLSKLSKSSPTRQRLEAARELFDEGWRVLAKGKRPFNCIKFFAQAVEIDEMGCSWKHNYVEKMEQLQIIGDFFEQLPLKNDTEKYYSMLVEAYLVVILYTLLSSYEKHHQDVEEDYKVVKSRMDVCVQLQKENPAIYKLRADFCMRLGSAADPKLIEKDLKTAIKLAEDDEDGKKLNCKGVDQKQQRLYIMAWCHQQLGCLAQQDQDLPRAREHYEQVTKLADPDYYGLAQCFFNLCVIVLMTAKKVEPEERPSITLKALTMYQEGVAAERRTLRYLPHIRDVDVPRNLSKELLKRFNKGTAQ